MYRQHNINRQKGSERLKPVPTCQTFDCHSVTVTFTAQVKDIVFPTEPHLDDEPITLNNGPPSKLNHQAALNDEQRL